MKLGILILGGRWAVLALIPGTVGAERAFPRCEVTSMNFQHLSINQSIHPYEILIAIVLLLLLRNVAVA